MLFLYITLFTALGMLALAGLLHLMPRLGAPGKAAAGFFTRAPGLDLLIVAFQIAPIAAGVATGGWLGLAAALTGMLLGYFLWVWLHELTHLEAMRGARIVKTLNGVLGGGVKGRLRNHLAVWATALALPVFWLVRAAELFVYPLLVLLLGFPKYKQGEWVAVSRQKFDGLVGHDLIWCLYCDWMTGVYSLGAEMLRNVESFWCPIRFYSGKKCDNCAIDFPDVNGGWVPADGTMDQVAGKLEEMYTGEHKGWFGHPTRLTVEGREPGAEGGGGS